MRVARFICFNKTTDSQVVCCQLSAAGLKLKIKIQRESLTLMMMGKFHQGCQLLASATVKSLVRQASTVIQPLPKPVNPKFHTNKPVSLVNMNVMNAMVTKLQNDIPRSLPIIGILKNAVEGRVLCKVHTDEWPEFNTVVCEIVYPRVSEVSDLLCYSIGSGYDVLNVLQRNNLVSWGKKQQIYHLEDDLADSLLQNLVIPGTNEAAVESSFEAVTYSLTKGIQDDMSCPEGFVIGKLRAHHAPLVASNWKKYSSWPRSTSFIEGLISDFESKAVYHCGDLDNPVAWIMQYPFGRLAGLYTLRQYRQKDFGTLLTVALSKSIAASGLIPEALTEVKNTASRKITQKLGFVESTYHLQWLVVKA